MNEYLIPLLLVLLASLFQGTFGLGMKYVKPLAWEAWWLVHATVAMVIFPLVWALLVVPDLGGGDQLRRRLNELVAGALLGFLWGIGGIMFGVSVGYIGMSLTYGIVMGLCSIAGALISLFMRFRFSRTGQSAVHLCRARAVGGGRRDCHGGRIETGQAVGRSRRGTARHQEGQGVPHRIGDCLGLRNSLVDARGRI